MQELESRLRWKANFRKSLSCGLVLVGFGFAAALLRCGSGVSRASPNQSADLMKRIATWLFYAVGALAVAYLALYAYAAFTGRDLQPGDPIHIFRKPDAPDYS